MKRRVELTPALRLATGRYQFRESLFELPTLVVLGGGALAETTAYIDRALGAETQLPFTVEMNTNAATWLLSTVAGAMITTAGVVFSLTVVSLQLASSQFSPRVMRSFIRNRLSQTVIGMLVATFVFCVLVLRHINGDANASAPRISMTLAIVLTVTTVLLIIAYLDRLARGLQVGEVVRTIAAEADDVIEVIGRQTKNEKHAPSAVTSVPSERLMVHAMSDGWVTQAPSKYILGAVPPSTVVRLETRTGAYIHRDEILMTVWPVPGDPRRVEDKLLSTVEIADVRTMQQDIDFGIRQLVDVALRALSSAINDPTTATEVVLRLGSIMRTLLSADLPHSEVAGSDGRILLRPWDLSHDEYIAHAFEQIRQTGIGQPHVVTALLRVLRMLIDHSRSIGREEHLPALRHQIELLMDAMATAPGLHPADLARLRAIADETATDPAEHDTN
ncbi:hypothetical protein A5634_14645 [Mycobacterium asiaticum]|uniref:DUF2254 domain-containing protein n=1 Tax=Mycobacterium asiaticum TaxID=1790 RepID=A0A1A3PEQ2_MYCAS|nr:DUF2254 domain-containing protein [Mycobacterium asiaticum]OBK31077.1 hypothetical protein A5634_14645 [Mycobacterium asiaticum]